MVCQLAHHRFVGRQSVPAFRVWFHGKSIMQQPGGPDHDQRLKVLLKEFFEGFFLCFFPDWAPRFEFTDIDWLRRSPPTAARQYPRATSARP